MGVPTVTDTSERFPFLSRKGDQFGLHRHLLILANERPREATASTSQKGHAKIPEIFPDGNFMTEHSLGDKMRQPFGIAFVDAHDGGAYLTISLNQIPRCSNNDTVDTGDGSEVSDALHQFMVKCFQGILSGYDKQILVHGIDDNGLDRFVRIRKNFKIGLPGRHRSRSTAPFREGLSQ